MSENYLTSLRSEIDSIDAQLLELLSKRFDVVKKVWEYKKEKWIPALQSGRWKSVLESRIEHWKRLGIPPGCIEKIWNNIHETALDLENNI